MSPNSIIPQSDDRLLSYFLAEIAKSIFGIGKDKNSKSDDLVILYLLGLIFLVATEPYKVLIRKNIGKLSLSLFRLIACAALYAIWGVLLLIPLLSDEFSELHSAFLAGAVFYLLLAIMLCVVGIIEYIKASRRYKSSENIIEHIYRGDSILFQSKVDAGTDIKKIWQVKEPLACLLFSLTLTIIPMFIHPLFGLIGAPLIASSLSFWFNEWFQINNVWNVQTKKILREQAKIKQGPPNAIDEPYQIVTND